MTLPAASVDEVIVEPDAASPPPAPRDGALLGETDAYLALSETLAREPAHAQQQLVDLAMRLTGAHSAGLTIEASDAGETILRWAATAGEFASYVGGTMPRAFSPCGTAIERRRPLMMRDPVRYYPYMAEIAHVPIRSALLVPFSRRGAFVGTLWVLLHDETRSFTREDMRVIEGLATFAGALLDVQRNEKPRA